MPINSASSCCRTWTPPTASPAIWPGQRRCRRCRAGRVPARLSRLRWMARRSPKAWLLAIVRNCYLNRDRPTDPLRAAERVDGIDGSEPRCRRPRPRDRAAGKSDAAMLRRTIDTARTVPRNTDPARARRVQLQGDRHDHRRSDRHHHVAPRPRAHHALAPSCCPVARAAGRRRHERTPPTRSRSCTAWSMASSMPPTRW